MAHTFGSYLRAMRLQAGLSLRDVARDLGVSHVYWSEVERGVRGLARERWDALMRLLPDVDAEQLARLESVRKPIHIDLSGKPSDLQAVGLAFARRVQDNSLSDEQIQELLVLLGAAKENS